MTVNTVILIQSSANKQKYLPFFLNLLLSCMIYTLLVVLLTLITAGNMSGAAVTRGNKMLI